MHSTDERREVAARLRDAKRKCDGRGYPWMTDDLILAIGNEHDYEADNGIFDRLADLIDPTCCVDSVDSTAGLPAYNLSCGDTVFVHLNEPMPSYCPYCGARVVR